MLLPLINFTKAKEAKKPSHLQKNLIILLYIIIYNNIIYNKLIFAFVMELVDILVLGTSAERRAGSNPAEGNL